MYQFELFMSNDDQEWQDDFDQTTWHPGWSEPMPAKEEDLIWDDTVEENI